MKVLIVDDEIHVITAVKLLVPWSDLGITQIFEAYNAQDAIQIMEQEKPEILITDIVMQDLSGIDLMEYVNHAPFRTKVVVISGYDNFEYVRGSLQNGSVDYLLKPLDQDQLIAALRKAADCWNQEESLLSTVQSHADKIQSMTTLCKENLMSKLLSGEYSEDIFDKLFQLCPELKKHPAYGISCCQLKPFFDTESSSEEISKFRNILNAFGKETNAGFLLPSGDSQEILFFLSNPSADILRQLEQWLESCRKSFSFPVSMGLATSNAFPYRLKETLNLAREAYGCLNTISLTPALCQINDFRLPVPVPADDDDKNLLSSLLTGNEVLITQTISHWLNHKLDPSCPPNLTTVLQIIEDEKNYLTAGYTYLKNAIPIFITILLIVLFPTKMYVIRIFRFL